MKTKPILLLCMISVILILVRLKTSTPPEQIPVTPASCGDDAIKSIPDVTERAILSARCAKEKNSSSPRDTPGKSAQGFKERSEVFQCAESSIT